MKALSCAKVVNMMMMSVVKFCMLASLETLVTDFFQSY